MGLEGGSAVANSVPNCLSFVQGPGTVLAILERRALGEGSYRRFFWQRISRGGRELFGRGLAEGGGSYRQFWERRALREGSHRRFFGREFAEGRGQLPPIFGEACPGGRQLSPIFWRRICRACRLRRQARKGEQSMEDYRKTIQKGTKKGPKWYPGGTEEPPKSDLEKRTHFPVE